MSNKRQTSKTSVNRISVRKLRVGPGGIWRGKRLPPGILSRPAMSSRSEPDLQEVERASAPPDALARRQNLVRILFAHRSAAEVERCLYELRRVRFTVCPEVVATPEQFVEQLGSQPFDLIVAEYPSTNWRETLVLELLGRMKKDIPVIFLAAGMKRETAAGFILKGAADCIEVDSIGHLPVAVHRALNEKALRDQRDRAEKDLRRSEARYRALAGNLSYGICRCSLDGRLLEINEAMMRILGYGSREELLALDLDFTRDIVQDAGRRAQLLGQSDADTLVDPIEIEWKRKDHSTVKVRLSGREVLSEQGDLGAYEIIAEDVTRQR